MSALSALERHVDPEAKRTDRRRAYSAMSLANLCAKFNQIPYERWDMDRKQALRDLQAWYNNWDSFREDSGYDVPDATDMKTAIALISKVFFGGLLNYLSFKWKTLNDVVDGKIQGDIIYATTDIPDEDDLSEDLPCTKQDARRRSRRDSYDHRAAILDTLLHECVHGFLGSYSCESITCPCIARSSCDLGKTGHGPAFILIAAHIAAAWEQTSIDPNFKPSLELQNSLKREFAASGHELSAQVIDCCPAASHHHLQSFRQRSVAVNERLKCLDSLLRGSMSAVELATAWMRARAAAVEEEAYWNLPLEDADFDLSEEIETQIAASGMSLTDAQSQGLLCSLLRSCL